MTDIQAPSVDVSVVTESTVDLNISQGWAYAIYNIPAEFIQSSGTVVNAVVSEPINVQASQAFVLAIVRGRIENPKLRAWSFILDGHEFYVLRAGEDKTFVYDLKTQQWSWWSSGTEDIWRLTYGINWKTPGQAAYEYGSNILCGDYNLGVLWILNPKQGYDDLPRESEEIVTFPRVATAQVISRGRAFIPVYDVFLTASPEEPAYPLAPVTLNYSDDGGQTFVNAGSIAVDSNDYRQEFAWRSLGRIQAPGRLFQIADDGAFARIDGLDINTMQEG